MTDANGLQGQGLALPNPQERAIEILLSAWNDAAAIRFWLKTFAVLLAGTYIYTVAQRRLAVLGGQVRFPGLPAGVQKYCIRSMSTARSLRSQLQL